MLLHAMTKIKNTDLYCVLFHLQFFILFLERNSDHGDVYFEPIAMGEVDNAKVVILDERFGEAVIELIESGTFGHREGVEVQVLTHPMMLAYQPAMSTVGSAAQVRFQEYWDNTIMKWADLKGLLSTVRVEI